MQRTALRVAADAERWTDAIAVPMERCDRLTSAPLLVEFRGRLAIGQLILFEPAAEHREHL